MLRLIIEGAELFNEETQQFSTTETAVLELEHSLLAVSKWESKYQKPFLVVGQKSRDEIYGYLRAMVLTPNADLGALDRCSQQNLNAVQAYIDSSQSATTFGSLPERRGPGEVVTSELIYFWMLSFNVPFECERWHLNRLFSLLRICNIKNSKQKMMSAADISRRNAELNAKRRAELGTNG